MSEMTFQHTTPTTDAEYEAEFDLLLQEMIRLETRMQADRADIERLRAESQVIAAHTDALLDQLDKQLDGLRRKT